MFNLLCFFFMSTDLRLRKCKHRFRCTYSTNKRIYVMISFEDTYTYIMHRLFFIYLFFYNQHTTLNSYRIQNTVSLLHTRTELTIIRRVL